MLIPVKIKDSIEIENIEIENTNFKSLNLREEHIEEFLRKNIEIIFEDETLLVVGKQVVNKENGRSDLTAVDKNCFVEPEIHEKLKKMPSGRKKLITKCIPVSVEYDKMIEDELITIENCSNCWYTTNDGKHIDVMALHILFYVFLRYQEEGKIPGYISYNV